MKETIDINQDMPSLIIEIQDPLPKSLPPPPPQIAKKNHFSHCGSYMRTGCSLYFIRILTSLSYNLCFYPYQKPNHRTQFTTALRDVKEAFHRGQGSTDSPRSDRGYP